MSSGFLQGKTQINMYEFTGVYIVVIIFALNQGLWVLVRTALVKQF